MIDELKVEEPKKEKPEELKIQERPEIPQTIPQDFSITPKTKISNTVDDLGIIEIVSAAPTHIPIHPLKRIVIYKSGATYRVYFYDNVNNSWRYASLT